MIETAQALTRWIPQVTGRYLNEDWNPTNAGFGAQCWDVAANWSRYLGLPVISTGNTATKRGRWPGWAGNMVDVFPQTPEISAAYELVGPDRADRPGDIVVWGDSNPFYPKTHVAVLVKDPGGQLLLCISQNSSASQPGNPYPHWTTGPTILQHLPRKGLLGFIRPRSGISAQSTITPASEEDELNSDQNNALGAVYNRVNHVPEAGLVASQGDINIMLARMNNLEDTVLEALGKPRPEPSAIVVKGDQEDTVYAWDGGTGYRALNYAEFAALMATGAELRTVEQATINGGK